MPRGRPPLPVGQHGKIGTPVQVGPSRYKARAYYRATDGRRYTMARFGQTKAAARRALEAALAEWQRDALPPTADMRVGVLLDQWLDEVKASGRAVNTRQLYEHMVGRLRPRLEALTVRELTTGYCDRVLQDIASSTPSAASTARKVLKGAMSYAVRQGLVQTNPVRETRPISTKPKHQPRALTRVEAEDLVDKLRADPRAVEADLPDLVDFMLGTGVRIGEALAVRESSIDLEARTVHIDATVVRVKGVGLIIQPHPKSKAGDRVLPLPQYVADLISRRRAELRFESPERVLFPSPFGPALRDQSNTTKALRAVLDRLGYDWVSSHSFRKTAITWLHQAGIDKEVVASFGGHDDLLTATNVYIGRTRTIGAEAAEVLDR